MIKRKVGIIGAGPAGLAGLKAVLDSPQYQSGLWDDPVALEAKSNVGGVWCKSPASIGLGSQSPIYDSLTTNLPYPVMAFSSFSFPPDTPLYPPADIAQTYLEAFANEFDLRRFIVFDTKVICADWSHDRNGGNWIVDTETTIPQTPTTKKGRYHFDLLMLCNGHFSEPRYPSIIGLDSWISAGHVLHSVNYRNPSSIEIPGVTPSRSAEHQHLKDATILVIGGGPSGSDISAELVPIAKRVLHSFSPTSAASRAVDAPPQTKPASEELRQLSPSVANPAPKPRVTSFSHIESSQSRRSVHFEDGTVEHDIDYCVLATGYIFSYPFFDACLPPDLSSSNSTTQRVFRMIHDLVPLMPHDNPSDHLSITLPNELFNTSFGLFPLASHLLGFSGSGFSSLSTPNPTNEANDRLPSPTNIAFLGLPIRVTPFPLVEAQAKAAVAAFAYYNSHHAGLNDGVDWTLEKDLIKKRWDLLTAKWEELNKDHAWKDNDERDISLRIYLSKEWHRFELENMQFEYRDRMHELAYRLQSQMQSSNSSLSPPLPAVRVRHWEPEMYSLKEVLRRAWVAWAKEYSAGDDGISEEGVRLRNLWSRFEDGNDEDGARGEPGDTVRFMRGLLGWYRDISAQETSS